MTSSSVDYSKTFAQRDALGDALVKLGGKYPDLVVLSPDVAPSTKATKFQAVYPDRYVCTGIAEQNTVGMASGLSTAGWVPLVAAYAMFMAGKAWEPIRNTIGYPKTNVKLVATHAGLNVGPDGVTHQATEDIALMRSIPGMTVLTPTDANQVLPSLYAAMEINGPVYVRLERAAIPVLTDPQAPVSVGKSLLMRDGTDATVFAVGSMVATALEAADKLSAEGVDTRVISMVSLKPIDEDAIVRAARETGTIVTAEDHNRYGGLGGAVAEVLARLAPAPMEQVAVNDVFAESGTSNQLHEIYHLTAKDVAEAIRHAIARRNNNLGSNNGRTRA